MGRLSSAATIGSLCITEIPFLRPKTISRDESSLELLEQHQVHAVGDRLQARVVRVQPVTAVESRQELGGVRRVVSGRVLIDDAVAAAGRPANDFPFLRRLAREHSRSKNRLSIE